MARAAVKAQATTALVIKRSRIAGKGGFAGRDIRNGERIVEYLGERITHAVADARYDDEADPHHHTFLFTASKTVVIDAAVDGNDARFINHSCAPNCEAIVTRSRVFIDAMRRIKAGEELFYDYAYPRDGTETEAQEFGVYACRCGAKNCRGSILAPRTQAQRAALARKNRLGR